MLLLALPSVLLLLQMEAERQQRIREDVAAELRVFYCEVLLLLPPPLASCPQGALTATRVQPAAGRWRLWCQWVALLHHAGVRLTRPLQ